MSQSSLSSLIQDYLHVNGVDITVRLSDGSKIRLNNAIITHKGIVNHYLENPENTAIPFSEVKHAEFSAA